MPLLLKKTLHCRTQDINNIIPAVFQDKFYMPRKCVCDSLLFTFLFFLAVFAEVYASAHVGFLFHCAAAVRAE